MTVYMTKSDPRGEHSFSFSLILLPLSRKNSVAALTAFFAMPTYVYETIPAKKGAKPKQYELRQSIKDPAYTHHPETGEAVRRAITSGAGLITSHAPQGHSHTSSCGCGAGGCH